MTLLQLFYAFFTSGLFVFGGGLAIIPFLNDMMDKWGWFTQNDLTTLIALSEVTPGALGVNMATYAGFLAFGFAGAVVATFSLVLPSVLIVSILSPKWHKIKDKKEIVSVFNSIKIATAGLIASIFISLFFPLFQKDIFSVHSLITLVLFVIGIGLMSVKKMPMPLFLAVMSLLGVMFY